jgi:alpha-N-acetylglucosamine transferase
MTDYKSILYLDLDTILVSKIDELFECGTFCASLRHSDAFNSGVMVIRPNNTVSLYFQK